MDRRRILWQIYPSYLVITVVLLTAAALYASSTFRDFYIQKTEEDLREMALIIEKVAAADLASGRTSGMDRLAKTLGDRPHVRITVILPDGRVVGDSLEDPESMDNHADRPEVAAALAGTPGTSTRVSHTVGESMMYVALPVTDKGKVAGVVRSAVSVSSIDSVLREFYIKVAYGGVAALVFAALVGLAVSRRLTSPLVELERVARRFADGDLAIRLPLSDTEEIANLAAAMNEMAQSLDDRIKDVTRRKNEQAAILASMVEGVVAVDTDERIINMNQAAAGLLGADRERARGRSLREVVRNAELMQFMEDALNRDRPVETEVVLRGAGERFIRVIGSKLIDSAGRGIGALVVLNDVTRLRKLENIRRDFVANVSHELRTPVTAIQGYAETLADGGLNDPDVAVKFMSGIVAQSNRLNAIIDDLLSLSNIERMEEAGHIRLEQASLSGVVGSAVDACRFDADARDIAIEVSCPGEIKAMLNPQLMEQAVINLVVNAVKYSEPGSPVRVSCDEDESECRIAVEDHGCGIEARHFDRLFERFYRIDKARSRSAGGTGLGLAIVKHIVAAHGGRISVKSRPGEGSTFTIHLK